MSDTSISNKDAARANAIPGRLKSVVISPRLTISYAGLSSQANDAIRRVARRPSASVDESISELLESSVRHTPELDFILCSHETNGSSRLVRISDGQVQEGADFYWIGSAESASSLSKIALPANVKSDLPNHVSVKEQTLVHQFMSHVSSGSDPLVGGAAVNCLCSEYGHCYQNHASAEAWDIVLRFPSLPEDEQKLLRNRKAGLNHYVYNMCSPAERGIGVVGFYLEQPEVGWIHDPILRDDPIKVPAHSVPAFDEQLKCYVASRHLQQ